MNSIKQIDYEVESPEVPKPFASLIQDADARWERFWSKKLNKRYPRYVASEPAQVYAALKHVRDEGLALGERFIEWGSGFGVATSLAAQLGFEATGIELEDGQTKQSRLGGTQTACKVFQRNSTNSSGHVEAEFSRHTDCVL